MIMDKSAIACWQQFLNRAGFRDDRGSVLVEDGILGPRTKQATKQFQSSRGISPTGEISSETLSIAASMRLDSESSTDGFKVPIRHENLNGTKFNRANRGIGQITLVCIHTAECADTPKSDQNIINYLHTSKVAASAHYAVDQDSITLGVEEKNIAWHAGPINNRSIGIELAGYAKFTRDVWLQHPSFSTLKNAAYLTADIVKRYQIPIVECTPDDLIAKKSGITTHVAAVKAFKSGSHWDPGPGFPMDVFLTLVAKFAGV